MEADTSDLIARILTASTVAELSAGRDVLARPDAAAGEIPIAAVIAEWARLHTTRIS